MKYYKINMAIDLLIHNAVDGKILSNDAYRITKEAGVSARTVERAKREANIKSGRGSANERIWIIPDDVKIIKSPALILKEPRQNLPIVYINPQEQVESAAPETRESCISEKNQEFDISKLKRIFIICTALSFAGKFDAFAVRIPRALEENILIGDVFVFCNSIKTQISVLQWQGDGYAQYFKRSEYVRFPWPSRKEAGAVEITPDDLKMLLEYPRLMLRLSGVPTPRKVM